VEIRPRLADCGLEIRDLENAESRAIA
jgi:hypothetical protein